MVRAIAIAGLIGGLIAAVIFGPGMLDDTGNAAKNNGAGQSLAECDLIAGPCQWTTQAGDWQVVLEPLGEGEQGTEYRLAVTTPERPERFLAVLRGESMYMGEYPVPLGNRTGNRYSARFTAPFCTVDATMTWRVDLQQGQALIDDIPLKLVFEAKPH
ncbi:MAG: hypothetical protein H5U30_01635 [Marinobacter sp.]|nr:hypothetical protein [Marinobacter sp.]